MTTIIYVVRHGETDWNREDRLQGHSDIPINETGRAQARAAAEKLKKQKVDVIYSSDLMRAMETAAIIHHEIGCSQIIRSQLLRERFFGYGEGKTWPEVHQELPHCRTIEQLPEAESLADVQKRAFTLLEQIIHVHQGQSVVLVTHGAWMEALLKTIGSVSVSPIIIGNGACMTLIYRGSGWEWGGFLP